MRVWRSGLLPAVIFAVTIVVHMSEMTGIVLMPSKLLRFWISFHHSKEYVCPVERLR
ncbi:hypothetical protein D3C73_1484970 [compost metagenome]